MKKVAISFILFSIFVASCTKINDTVPLKSSEPESLPAGYLTVDDAVANLNNFLSAVQGPATKSGDESKIKSVEAHYDNTVLTRSGESVPDAYLVNFDNDEGFAVLGAKSTIAPVIAVVEQGNTTWDKIMNP
ncbi:MAG: Spi family protease inhibitor, partial [Bacteroidales bacterium]|nr:Spi family protease inhibitor [Bacteroidales bacterium]